MIVGVCRRLSSVTLPAGGRASHRARGRSGGRHCTAGQYGYVPLGRHLVVIVLSLYEMDITHLCRHTGDWGVTWHARSGDVISLELSVFSACGRRLASSSVEELGQPADVTRYVTVVVTADVTSSPGHVTSPHLRRQAWPSRSRSDVTHWIFNMNVIYTSCL